MDWKETRYAASNYKLHYGEKDGEWMAAALLDLIPADPNKKADAEWLKERGWVTGPEAQNPSWRFSHPTGELDVTFYDDDVPRLFVFGEREIPNPTRMTVALFEAAAMEAMKHG